MKVLFYLHHPAHFHLFKNVIRILKGKGYQVIILATKKDILEELLQREKIPYINVLPNGRKDNIFSIALSLLKQDFRLMKICLRLKPDMLIGTSTEITHIGKILGIPNVFVNEDDIDIIPLVGKLAYPFAMHLLLPDICRAGKYEAKKISYPGYHELAYLHPINFLPEKQIVSKYFDPDDKYFIMRFSKLNAHHDKGARGITTDVAERIIKILEPHGRVHITSERQLEPQFEKYRLVINPLDMHHIMAHAQICIGDSQTMMAESGVLGTPFVRFNDFVGRISVLADLEDKYRLGFGVRTSEPDKLCSTLTDLVNTVDLKEKWQERKMRMLSEKTDVSAFLLRFIENYPESARTLNEKTMKSQDKIKKELSGVI